MSGLAASAGREPPGQPIVVDASVAAKWFLPEVHAEAALSLLSPDFVLLAPDLLFPEVGNIVWKRVRAGEISPAEAAAVMHVLGGIPMAIHPAWPLVLSSLEIACSTGRSVYDCMYLALAVREAALLVTTDERLVNALAGGPLAGYLRSVGDSSFRRPSQAREDG